MELHYVGNGTLQSSLYFRFDDSFRFRKFFLGYADIFRRQFYAVNQLSIVKKAFVTVFAHISNNLVNNLCCRHVSAEHSIRACLNTRR